MGLFDFMFGKKTPPPPAPPKVDYGGYETVAVNPATGKFEITGSYNKAADTYTTTGGSVSQGAPVSYGATQYTTGGAVPTTRTEVEINKELAAASSAAGRTLTSAEIKVIQNKKRLYGANIKLGDIGGNGSVNFAGFGGINIGGSTGNIKVNYPTQGTNLPNQRVTRTDISPIKSYQNIINQGAYNPNTNSMTMNSMSGFGGNKMVYEVDRSKYVNFSGTSTPLVYKADVMVNENGVIRNATASERNAFYKEKENTKEKARLNYQRQSSYGNLSASGDYPTMVRKGFGDIGTAWFGLTSGIATTVTGRQKISEEQKRAGGEIMGTAGLWAFFAPAMATGSYGEAFEQLSPKKSGTKQILAENKFGALGEGLNADTANSIFNRVSRELINKKSALEQTKYLNELAGNLKTAADKDAFRSLVQELYNQGIYKGFPLTNLPKTSVSNIGVSYWGQPLPSLKNIGSITGLSTANYDSVFDRTKEPPPSTKTSSVSNSFMNVMLGTGVSNLPVTKTLNKQENRQVSNSFMSIMLGTPQAQPQKNKQVTLQKTIQTQKNAYPQPQIPKNNYPYRPLYPFILPKKPKKSYSWGYPTRSGKTKTRQTKYQPSLASYMLGITAPKGYRFNQRFTGVEIRPQFQYKFKSQIPKNYMKNLNKVLLGSSYKQKRKVKSKRRKR